MTARSIVAYLVHGWTTTLLLAERNYAVVASPRRRQLVARLLARWCGWVGDMMVELLAHTILVSVPAG